VRSRLLSGIVISGSIIGVLTAGVTANASAAPAVVDTLLNSVSCLSAHDCVAVGGHFNQASAVFGTTPLAEIYNGATWRTSTPKLPTGAVEGALSSVSCTRDKCVAIGWEFTKTTEYAYGDVLDGGRWTATKLAVPAGSIGYALPSVSCATARDCVAVGGYERRNGTFVPLAEEYNGRTWAATRLPVNVASSVTFDSVSCVPGGHCLAAGIIERIAGGNVAEELTGHGWKEISTPQPAGFQPSGASCTAADECTVVGNIINIGSRAYVGYTLRLSGTRWTEEKIDWPKGDSGIQGVGCASATRCYAVGYDTSGAAAVTLNGTAGSPDKVTTLPDIHDSVLTGVTCLSATSCIAVGDAAHEASGPRFALAAFGNGTTWRDVAVS
jgi:hypothetical protein